MSCQIFTFIKKLNYQIFFMKLRLCSFSEVKTRNTITTKFLWRIISVLLRFYMRISENWWGSYSICGRKRGTIFMRLIVMRRLEEAKAGSKRIYKWYSWTNKRTLHRCNAVQIELWKCLQQCFSSRILSTSFGHNCLHGS